MKSFLYDETISAIATAPGEGGIGIIRISGDKSLEILNKIFDRKDQISPNHLTYGHISDPYKDEMIDEAMAVYMKAPHSYTGEDVCEIQCHGSIVSLRRILELTFRMGARSAEPGEFTKRAFLNGRLDLSQAEAVIDLIRAKSETTFDVALGQLEGLFSSCVRKLRARLTDTLVNVTVNIDYPDEDIEIVTYQRLIAELNDIKEEIKKLLSSASTGRILRDGLKVSIIGKPNVGKSSLMNALLKETRAIVTSIPGTTRDTIEEMMTVRNIPIILTDTAGIRETEDIIEKIGIEKSKKALEEADLVILVLDQSTGIDEEDMKILDMVGDFYDGRIIFLLNKSDIEYKIAPECITKKFKNSIVIDAAIKEGRGLSEIEDEIEHLVYAGEVKSDSRLIVTNARHAGLLNEALSSLTDAISGAEAGQPLEFLEIDISHAYEALGLIIGEEVEDDIINEVFRRFCLGK